MTKAAVEGLRLLPEKAKTMDVERVRAGLLQADEVDLPEAEQLDAELRVWKDFEEVVTTNRNKRPRRMLLGRPLDA